AGGGLTGPWVLLTPRLSPAARLAAAEAAPGGLSGAEASLAAGSASSGLTASGGFLHLGGGPAQRGADLIDVELPCRAAFALTGLKAAGLQSALGDDAHPGAQRLRRILSRLAPQRAAHEQRLAVSPLTALTVEEPRSRGDGEVRHRRAGRCVPQFRVGGEVAHQSHDRVVSHAALLELCT